MKNFTRVLALVVVFTMMLGSVAFAATFTDVKDSDAHAEASSVLADLGILSGYPDGTFGAEKTITRAEIAAVLCRALGLEEASKGAAGKTAFDDVAADHWASGNINMANQLGIILGDGDGKFRPEDPVKYEEAVKMIVAALGYEPAALDKGGWPTGYLVIASERQITKSIGAKAGDAAQRGDVARMIYQSLDVPLMERVGFGNDATYQMMDGRNGVAKKTILSDKLGIYKMKGVVTANDITSLSSSKAKDGYVKYVVTDDYGIGEYPVSPAAYDFLVGNSDAKNFVGFASIVYVQENNAGDDEVVLIVEEKGKNYTEEINTPQDIAPLGRGSNTRQTKGFGDSSSDVVQYAWYENPDDAEPVLFELNPDAILMYNGKFAGNVRDSKFANVYDGQVIVRDYSFYYAPQAGNVKLLDNDRDDLFDIVYVTHYVTDMVDTVNVRDARISLKNSAVRVSLDTKADKDLKYTLTIDGKEGKLEDLKENDVISFAFSEDLKNIDIIVVRDVVEGEVNSYDATNQIYTIAGDDYEIAPNDNWNLGYNFTADRDVRIKSGDEGRFYIDAFGRIIANERVSTSTSAKNYGFITGFDKADSYMSSNSFSIRIMDTDGKNTTYDFADKLNIEVTYSDNGSLDVYSVSNVPVEDIVGDVEATELEDVAGATYDGPAIPTIASLMKVSSIAPASEKPALYAKRMVTYRTNSSNKISALSFIADAIDTTDDNEFMLVKGLTEGSKKYNAATKTLDERFSVSNETVVFLAPARNGVEDIEDFKIATIDSLTDDDSNAGTYIFDVNRDFKVGMLLITDGSSSVLDSSNWAVITKVTDAAKDGDRINRITYYQNGELKTTDTTPECEWDNGSYNSSVYKEGAVISFGVNASGDIDKVKLASPSLTEVKTPSNDNNAKLYHISGYVYRRITSDKAIMVGWEESAQLRVVIPESANVYVVDNTKRSGYRVTDGTFADIDVASFYGGNVEDDNRVFIRQYDGYIVDVVIIKN